MRRPQPIYPLCISLVALVREGDSSILVHLQRTIVVGTEEICLLKLHDTHLEVAAQVLFMSLLLPRRPGTEVERGVRRGSGCGRRLGSRTSVRACFCVLRRYTTNTVRGSRQDSACPLLLRLSLSFIAFVSLLRLSLCLIKTACPLLRLFLQKETTARESRQGVAGHHSASEYPPVNSARPCVCECVCLDTLDSTPWKLKRKS